MKQQTFFRDVYVLYWGLNLPMHVLGLSLRWFIRFPLYKQSFFNIFQDFCLWRCLKQTQDVSFQAMLWEGRNHEMLMQLILERFLVFAEKTQNTGTVSFLTSVFCFWAGFCSPFFLLGFCWFLMGLLNGFWWSKTQFNLTQAGRDSSESRVGSALPCRNVAVIGFWQFWFERSPYKSPFSSFLVFF